MHLAFPRGPNVPSSALAGAVDLLCRCLDPDPSCRPSMRDVLLHPFLNSDRPIKSQVLISSTPEWGFNPESGKFDLNVMERLQSLCKENTGCIGIACAISMLTPFSSMDDLDSHTGTTGQEVLLPKKGTHRFGPSCKFLCRAPS